MAKLLASRGIAAEGLEEFFEPSLKSLAEPSALPGVVEAARSILAKIRSRSKIVVFGDYDCDGVCASAILTETISALGGDVTPFLPERLSEGYGMGEAAVKRMLEENPEVSLVITVDNGINSAGCVEELKSRGVEAVVTDHHLPGDILPACPVVNPKVASPEALDSLCGAGVAFLVAGELVKAAKEEGLYSGRSIAAPLIVLAGLATVTDIMPLKGQNRILVASALKLFWKHAPVGLKELILRASRRASTALTAKDFGFLIGPRVNAAGRMGSGMDALKLVLSRDREEARELARIVDLRNVERKSVEQDMTEEAFSKVVHGAAAQVLDLPGGHPGVAGIVASRVLEKLSHEAAVPVCVSVGSHGSARAPEGYNVRDAFQECAGYLNSFGGHAAAGGFSVKEGMIDSFREAFALACSKQASLAPEAGAVYCDAWVEGSELTLDFVESLSRLEPFGEGNPEPVFALGGVSLADARPLGSEGRHLALSFRGRVPRAVWWNMGDKAEELRAASSKAFDLLCTAVVSDYGERHVELRVMDMRQG